MTRPPLRIAAVLIAFAWPMPRASADVGDPQVRTDDPWYPGELAVSTFERLFATQAEAYRRVVGHAPATDEEKALASWLWRNTHYWHGEEGAEDLWGQGFARGGDLRTRDYWTGLFAHGLGLCGTTHSQWTAEMEALLGHGRGRGVGVSGHNSFEVFLRGGPYGDGRWALLDHDISTVIFDRDGKRLLSIREVRDDWQRLARPGADPASQHGWPVCGLHPDDGSVYQSYDVAEPLAGYAGPPPMVHLRRGETFRRYLRPGLDDGRTFVFWGRNMNAGGIPGPERSRTWVNQPGAMHHARNGAGFHPGQARFANAVFRYRPDFATGDYREGVVDEGDDHVTFEFTSPYIIAATPPNDAPWGIYDEGGRNGLVINSTADCAVSVSTDRGASWQDCGPLRDGLDLTDRVKGRRQYRLRLHSGAKALKNSGLTMTTVCQANASTMPHLSDRGSRVEYRSSSRAVVSAGPNLDQAAPHVISGKFGTDAVTLELSTPRGEPVAALYAAAQVGSGNPPDPSVQYAIDVSTDGGSSWKPIISDWTVPLLGDQPGDAWSQSFCWGSIELPEDTGPTVRVRFRNDGRRPVLRAEAHLAYRTGLTDQLDVTFAWTDAAGDRRDTHRVAAGREAEAWVVPTGQNVTTRWVEFAPRAADPGRP